MKSSAARVLRWGILLAVALAIGGSLAGAQGTPFPIPVAGEWRSATNKAGSPWDPEWDPPEVEIVQGTRLGAGYTVRFNQNIPWFEIKGKPGLWCGIRKGSDFQYWIETSTPNHYNVIQWLPASKKDFFARKEIVTGCGQAVERYLIPDFVLTDVELSITSRRRVAPGPYSYFLDLRRVRTWQSYYSDKQVVTPPEPIQPAPPACDPQTDKEPPIVVVYPAIVNVGDTAKLRYWAWDNCGVLLNMVARVFRGTSATCHPPGTTTCPDALLEGYFTSRNARAQEYFIELRDVAQKFAGNDTWCLQQTWDRVGNRAAEACAPLTVLPAKSAPRPPALPAALKAARRPTTGYMTKTGKPVSPSTPTKPTTPKKGDHTAPVVQALPASGKRGQPIELRYRASDKSGVTQETISVRRGKEHQENTLEFHQSKAGVIARLKRSSQHRLGGWSIEARRGPRLASSSRGFSLVGC